MEALISRRPNDGREVLHMRLVLDSKFWKVYMGSVVFRNSGTCMVCGF